MTIGFIFNSGEDDPHLAWEDLRHGAFSAVLTDGYELGIIACQSEGLALLSVRDGNGDYVVRNITLNPYSDCDYLDARSEYSLAYDYKHSVFIWGRR